MVKALTTRVVMVAARLRGSAIAAGRGYRALGNRMGNRAQVASFDNEVIKDIDGGDVEL